MHIKLLLVGRRINGVVIIAAINIKKKKLNISHKYYKKRTSRVHMVSKNF